MAIQDDWRQMEASFGDAAGEVVLSSYQSAMARAGDVVKQLRGRGLDEAADLVAINVIGWL